MTALNEESKGISGEEQLLMDIKDILYHYTSIDSLVQIIEKKQLMFSSLLKCDDLDEPESADLGLIGRYVYVSCWTDESEESIPMWSQYSGNMHGVRIGMRKFPFRHNHLTFCTYETKAFL